jgi:glutaredoxin 3
MKKVRIYTTDWCGFCHRAKRILESEGVPFEEIGVDGDFETRAWLREQSGQRTVPQIFFDDESIGGCNELQLMVYAGQLDERLGRTKGDEKAS